MADSSDSSAAFLADLERAAGGSENGDKRKARHQFGDFAGRRGCVAAAGQL